MAKGAHLTEEVKNLIAQIHIEHTDWGPTKIRKKLLKDLKERGIDLNFGSNWPGVSAVAIQLSRIREIENARLGIDPEDRPWSVSVLADYDIPPEALPVVMNAWAKALVEDAPLTIRQVKWIVRLYCIYPGLKDINLKHINMNYLTVRASEYADREKAIKLTGAYPEKPQNMRWLWFGDAWLYLDMRDKDIEIAKRLMKMYGIEYKVEKGGKQ
jgi:hypothetical protein